MKERRAPAGASPFAVLESPPLYDIVRDVNKLSNNVMARQIFLTLATTESATPATPARAAGTIRRWLAARKLKMPGLVLENGSGGYNAELLAHVVGERGRVMTVDLDPYVVNRTQRLCTE